MNNAPVVWNFAALVRLPLSVILAKTRTEQIDALYALADGGSLSRNESESILRIIQKISHD